MKTIAIVGSTGSIGTSALKVLNKNKKKFKFIFLSAHNNYKKLIDQKKIFKPKKIFLTSKNLNFKNKVYNLTDIKIFLKNYKKKIDYVISGASGYEALDINFQLLKISKKLLIANKETIICGGNLFLAEAKRKKCEIIPIDSEHYCVNFFIKKMNFNKEEIKKIYLIASGGPFFRKKIKYNENISKVIKHPNWNMGKKISIDSSNFSNKVLELFEAKILFGSFTNNFKIKVEEKSYVHSIIEFKNNLLFPIIHLPTMEIAISNSLGLSNKFELKYNQLNLNFITPSVKKFPIISLGYKILDDYSDKGMIIFTILNERLVQMYIEKKIKYGDIPFFLVKAFQNKKLIKESKKNVKNKKEMYETINYAKNIKL